MIDPIVGSMREIVPLIVLGIGLVVEIYLIDRYALDPTGGSG